MSQVLSGRCVRSMLAFVVLVLPLSLLTGRLHADVCEQLPKEMFCPDALPEGWTNECSSIEITDKIGNEQKDAAAVAECNKASQTDRLKGNFDCRSIPKAVGGCTQALDVNNSPLVTYCYKTYFCTVEVNAGRRSCVKTNVLDPDGSGTRTFNVSDRVNCIKEDKGGGPE